MIIWDSQKFLISKVVFYYSGTARRRRWRTQDKFRMIAETLLPSESISVVARHHGLAPNLLYRWQRLLTEGGSLAI